MMEQQIEAWEERKKERKKEREREREREREIFFLDFKNILYSSFTKTQTGQSITLCHHTVEI